MQVYSVRIMWYLVVLMFSCQLNLIHGHVRVDPMVETNVGLIKGLHATDGDYSMFLGIPYASVDENNPFGPSSPQAEFDDIFEAYDDSAVCPQMLQFTNTVGGSLNCLHLSVYVPSSASSRNRLPVMVWIYGGRFTSGTYGRNFYGPKFLVRQDVIVVSVNYRLGPYGFMCLDIPEVPGNQGLKDQLTALRWVKENIASFGGDDENITLFGESAGAASADLHFRFSKEKLFDKIILQSGSASSAWAVYEPDLEYSIKLAKLLGHETDNLDSSLQFLRTVDPVNLIGASLIADTVLGPCSEKDFDGVESFITDYAMNIKIPRAETTPILLGVNDEEGRTFHVNVDEKSFAELLSDEFYEYLNYGFNFTADEEVKVVNLLQRFYIGDNELSKALEFELSEFTSDFLFIYPMTKSFVEYFNDGSSRLYQYVFSYDGERNFFKVLGNYTGEGGAFHADELGYLFDFDGTTSYPNQRDQLMIDRITTLWTNFAKYGDPTPVTSELLPVKWPVVTPDKYTYLNLDYELSVRSRPFHDRMAFWDLFYAMNEHRRKGYRNNTN